MEIPAARIVFTEADRREIEGRVSAALASGQLVLGQNTRDFEEAFAAAQHAPYAVAVSSGTAAIEIILRALDVAGREVIVPADTFAATAFAVQAAGARPVFADIDAATLALCPETVAAAFTAETAAVVLVHIGGLVSPDITALRRLCDERGIALVEDAAHAHGCSLAGRYAGSFGVASAFSFYPTKVITSGEGGMILTADERIRDEALLYRDQGKAGFLGNQHVRQGYAWRISELHAAVGLVHLRHLEEFVALRSRVASRYTEALRESVALTPVVPPPNGRSNYYKYVALLADGIDRAWLKTRLRTEYGVALAGEVYESPLHRQPIFAPLARGPLPVAERVCARHVCLPLHSDMTEAEVEHVLRALRSVLS